MEEPDLNRLREIRKKKQLDNKLLVQRTPQKNTLGDLITFYISGNMLLFTVLWVILNATLFLIVFLIRYFQGQSNPIGRALGIQFRLYIIIQK
jgi:hypothetical protein